MTRGGDARIFLDPATGLNRYSSAPRPGEVLAFASSTANDLSADAMAHLEARFPSGVGHLQDGTRYGEFLDELRDAIALAYGLETSTDIFFAPSGTDLEYVGLLSVAGRRSGGIVNILLGADEVGSGCIYSAAGCYFANETALDIPVRPDLPVEGLPPIDMRDEPVRCAEGIAFESDTIADAIERDIANALARDCFPLVHVVHGSKTGLVLPKLDDVDRLRERFGSDVGFVVDACQARITADAIRAYLDRGMIVFITGSKFMGGPPFSGFALLPSGVARDAVPVPPGMANIFARAEVPSDWPGREICADIGNPGLALRLSASLFELARFQALPFERVERIVFAFCRAIAALMRRLDIREVASAPLGELGEAPAEHPIEMLTLMTLDLSHSRDGLRERPLDFAAAAAINRRLIESGIRLGQPVRCVKLANGEWGATLRVGLSMPQIVMLDTLDDDALEAWLGSAMERIGAQLALALASGACV